MADKSYLEQRALEPSKGWKEMVHRYLPVPSACASWASRSGRGGAVVPDPDQPVWLPTLLLALVVFQAALGMWTVTLLLKPIVVMGHLLGGFATFGLLVLLALRSARAGRRQRTAGGVRPRRPDC